MPRLICMILAASAVSPLDHSLRVEVGPGGQLFVDSSLGPDVRGMVVPELEVVPQQSPVLEMVGAGEPQVIEFIDAEPSAGGMPMVMGAAPSMVVAQSLEQAHEPAEMNQYSSMRSSVIRIQTVVQVLNPMRPDSPPGGDQAFVGSGFCVTKDDQGPLFVTNAHVVSDARQVAVQVPAIGQTTYRAHVALINPTWDIALLRLEKADAADLEKAFKDAGGELKAMPLRSSPGKILSGIDVVAMGFPLGQDSVKVTRGTLSGTEDLGDNGIVYQSTAPISPGNSGGPLLSDGKVIGINFAAAVGEGSQNNNFVIPAYRVVQMVQQYTKHAGSDGSFTADACTTDSSKCEYKVPKLGVTLEKGTELLSRLIGCPESKGIVVTTVSPHGTFASADPPVEPESLVLEVGGMAVDEFGMGRPEKYIQDPVGIRDLFFMRKDLDKPSVVKTCKCGKMVSHTVTHKWRPEMDKGIFDAPQPNLEKRARDYERFGNITMKELSKELATHLVQAGLVTLVDAMMDDQHAGIVIITDTTGVQRIEGKPVLMPGMIVASINGQPVTSLADVRASFQPRSDGECSTAQKSSKSVCSPAGDKAIWVMKTKEGRLHAVEYGTELQRLAHGHLTPAVKRALECEKIPVPQKASMVEDAVQPAGPALPIELRDVARITDALQIWPMEPTSLAEMGPKSIEPQSLMQRSSFLEMGPGAVEPESLVQVGHTKSSFVEMGPGGVDPESLVQVGHSR